MASPANKSIVECFYSAVDNEQTLILCICGTKRKQRDGTGLSNLVDRVKMAHVNCMKEIKDIEMQKKIGSSLGKYGGS